VKKFPFSVLFMMAFSCRVGISAELPIEMKPEAPDYQASMTIEETYSKPPPTEVTVLHHAGWSKVERRRAGDVSTTYGNSNVLVYVSGPPGGRPEQISIERTNAASNHAYRVRSIRPTTEYATQAGEKCRYYEIMPGPEQERYGPGDLSCITADGIEIAERALFSAGKPMSVTSLTALIRRPVGREEVLPRAEWFQSRYWLGPMRQAHAVDNAKHPDFVMTLQGDSGQMMLWRRHFPWNYQSIRERDGSLSVTAWNEVEFRGLYFSASKGGVFQSLFITRPSKPVRTSGLFGRGTTPKATGQIETLLGETCRWFDMTPGMMDASHHQCMTPDDIALKISNGSWGLVSHFEAISLVRRPVADEELLPDIEILRPLNWGFEARGG
jgi:hypothetical protein